MTLLKPFPVEELFSEEKSPNAGEELPEAKGFDPKRSVLVVVFEEPKPRGKLDALEDDASRAFGVVAPDELVPSEDGGNLKSSNFIGLVAAAWRTDGGVGPPNIFPGDAGLRTASDFGAPKPLSRLGENCRSE